MSTIRIIVGTFTSSVARQCRTGVSIPYGRMSCLLDDILAQEPRRFDQKNRDEDDEGNAVAVLAAAREIADDHHLDKTQNNCASYCPGYVTNPAENCGDECLDAGHKAHERVGAAVFDAPEDA